MNYGASITDFFKSPKWTMNLLLGGACALIPFVGQIVLKGWCITVFWSRETDDRPETVPDFDFNNFGKYLERGLWPFLVTLVTSIVLSFAACIVVVPFSMIVTLLGSNDHGSASGCAAALLFVILLIFYTVLIVGLMVLLTPLTIRASLMQEFGGAFNFTFIKRFISLTWKEIITASVFLVVVSLLLSAVGALLLCVGIYFATVLVYFCWVHLQKQLYRLYLSRGGEPMPVSPKLRDIQTGGTTSVSSQI